MNVVRGAASDSNAARCHFAGPLIARYWRRLGNDTLLSHILGHGLCSTPIVQDPSDESAFSGSSGNGGLQVRRQHYSDGGAKSTKVVMRRRGWHPHTIHVVDFGLGSAYVARPRNATY